MNPIYEQSATAMDGTRKSFSEFKGQVLLIVNTASKCGFTPQLRELETLYDKFKSRGFLVLGFPCNQFKDQDPEPNEAIREFCSVRYGVTFPLFAKTEVKGANIIPLYQFLTEEKGFEGFDPGHPLSQKLDEILSEEDSGYAQKNSVKWNFTKFLIGRDGRVLERFEPTASLSQVERAVEKALDEKAG